MTIDAKKVLPLKTLRDDGYLQEANRQFFHPLGLALAVIMPTKAGEPPASLVVLDWRDDPDGGRFTDGDSLTEKAAVLEGIATARVQARLDALGYWVQPTHALQDPTRTP